MEGLDSNRHAEMNGIKEGENLEGFHIFVKEGLETPDGLKVCEDLCLIKHRERSITDRNEAF